MNGILSTFDEQINSLIDIKESNQKLFSKIQNLSSLQNNPHLKALNESTNSLQSIELEFELKRAEMSTFQNSYEKPPTKIIETNQQGFI